MAPPTMFLVGKKVGEVFLEAAYRISPDWQLDDSTWPNGKLLQGLRNAIVGNYGGVVGDYSFYQCSDTERDRILNDDSYVPTWTANEITAADFSAEDAKKWLHIFALDAPAGSPKTVLIADNADSLYIRMEIWNAANTAVDPSETVDLKFNLVSGLKKKKVKTSFLSGVFFTTLQFKSKENMVGKLIIPVGDVRESGYRLDATDGQKIIDVVEDSTDFWV